jgi:serine/threonine-protein kinase
MRRVSETPAPLPADVPAPVRELVERTLATDPAARIPDAAALVPAVAGAAAGRAPEPADERTATRVLPVVPVQEPATATLPGSSFAAAAVPLVLPPLDDEDDDRGRLRRLVVPVLVGLVATALVVTGLVLGTRDVPTAAPAAAGPTTTAPPTPVAARPTSTYVRVDPAKHVGQQVTAVQAWLTGLDLTVTLVAVERADLPDGQVIALEPTGDLPVGTTVTVAHAVAPPAPPPPPTTAAPSPAVEDGGKGKDKDRGRGRDKKDDD